MSTKTNTIKAAVTLALQAAGKYGVSITELQALLAGKDSAAVRAAIMSPVAAFYGVALTPKAKGEGLCLDRETNGYEAAKKALQRLTADIIGKPVKDSEELEVPANILKAAKALIALCAEYEQAGKLLATALATAKAK